MCWRDGSAVNITNCYYRGPGFGSQHPHVTPAGIVVLGESSTLFWPQWALYTHSTLNSHRQNTKVVNLFKKVRRKQDYKMARW